MPTSKLEQLIISSDNLTTKLNDAFLRDMDEVLQKLVKKVNNMVAELDYKGGALNYTQKNLAEALRSISNIEQAFGEAGYTVAVKKYIKGYPKLVESSRRIWRELNPDFEWKNKNLETLQALQSIDFQHYALLPKMAGETLGKSIYEAVVSGGSFDDVRQDLLKVVDGPLKRYVTTYSQDALMAFNRTMDIIAGGDTGYFYYAGTLIVTSRQFCIDHVGKVYTAEEVKKWNSQKWAGQKPGDVRVVLGGWNCRHRLLPVTKEWALDKGLIAAGKEKQPEPKIKQEKVKKSEPQLSPLQKLVQKAESKIPNELKLATEQTKAAREQWKKTGDANPYFEERAKLERQMGAFRQSLLRDDSSYIADWFKGAKNVDSFTMDRVKNWATDAVRLANGKHKFGPLEHFDYTAARACAYHRGELAGTINIGNHIDKGTTFHEMGHFMEYADPEVFKAAIELRNKKSNGTLKKLKDITGVSAYDDIEMAFEDDFIHPYAGKQYKDWFGDDYATEMISMGFEYFTDEIEMTNFYQKDPEHFKLILGIIL